MESASRFDMKKMVSTVRNGRKREQGRVSCPGHRFVALCQHVRAEKAHGWCR